MRAALTALVIAAALAGATSATADPVAVPVQPLRDAGYTVGVASQLDATCTVWSVAGHGLSIDLNDCDTDAAATIASLTDPALIFERDWQLNHPDQVQAATTIANGCYSISRTAPATDQWHVVGGAADTLTDGNGLLALATTLPNLRLPDGSCPTAVTAVIVPTTTTTTTTQPDGTTTTDTVVTVPGSPTVVTAVDAAAQAQAANQPAAVTAAAAAVTAAARPDAVADANTAADSALAVAIDAGATEDAAALAARSAGLNALYGLDG